MNKKLISIINGPNLNMLGMREISIYGKLTLSEIELLCRKKVETYLYELEFRQSNHEGQIVDWIQDIAVKQDRYVGVIINPAAYAHTSIAIMDSLFLLNIVKVEVHLSDIMSREKFRHHSYAGLACDYRVMGRGENGYLDSINFVAGWSY